MRKHFLAFGLFFLGMPGSPLSAWQPCLWHGEKAWWDTNGPWLSIVSTERERLVFLGLAQEPESNLLYAPLDRAQGDWGGHRFWLGPQKEWTVFWPPPPDWEAKSAGAVETNGHELILTEPHDDAKWPALKRSYAWKDGRLILTARWSGGERAWQGIHILQVPGTATAEVHAVSSAKLPHGYALLPLANRPALQTDFNEPACVRRVKDRLTIRQTGLEEKIGVESSAIMVREGACGFHISPASFTGRTTGTTEDWAVPTQIYAGTDAYPFLEVEQLTPRLFTPASARVVIEPFATP